MGADVTSSTLWYAPYKSDTFPNLDATLTWQSITFSASPTDSVGPSLACGSQWAAGTSRDVFGLANGTLCSGQAWPASDLGSRNLVRYNGILVNSAALSCDTSPVSSIVVPPYQGTYLFSITNSVAGRLTADFTYGQDRKFEIWSPYNQIDIVLHAGEVLPSGVFTPTNQYPNWLPYNNDPLNRANIFTGLPTPVDVAYHQNFFINSVSGPSGAIALVGWDGVDLGFHAICSSDISSAMASAMGNVARYMNSSVVGRHTATMLVAKANQPTSAVFSGTPTGPPNNYTSAEGNSVLFAKYRG